MEVAYGTLPNRSRRELHATVARYLESTMGIVSADRRRSWPDMETSG